MKKITIVFAFAMMLFSAANAEYLRGDFNAWEPTFEMTEVGGWFTYSFQYSGDDGAKGFKVDQNGDWATSWGKNVNPSVNGVKGKATKGWGDNLSADMLQGKFYYFRLGGQANWDDREMVIFETDAAPVSFVSVLDDSINASTELTITLTMSANHTQDSVYIRYTTDSWGTSAIVKASGGDGMTYQAIIPSLPTGVQINYYALTSSCSQALLESSPDEYYLEIDNNSGDNYTYTVPVPTQMATQGSENVMIVRQVNNGMLQIKLNSQVSQNAQISLVSLSGRVNAQLSTTMLSGENSISLPQRIESGIYVVQVKTSESTFVKKVMVQ